MSYNLQILKKFADIPHKFSIFSLFSGLSAKPAWDIVTGVCIERLPVVTPPLNDIQKKYKAMLDAIEVEKSYKSDHEVKHDNDK